VFPEGCAINPEASRSQLDTLRVRWSGWIGKACSTAIGTASPGIRVNPCKAALMIAMMSGSFDGPESVTGGVVDIIYHLFF